MLIPLELATFTNKITDFDHSKKIITKYIYEKLAYCQHIKLLYYYFRIKILLLNYCFIFVAFFY